jgi:DNA-binding transcriptional ArsR family regulator
MATNQKELPEDVKYLIFQALSHPYRVKILMLIEGNELTFASLKHELGMESSGQLQHHLQKLSGLVTEKSSGSYGLTDLGRRALDIFRESERSGTSLEELCCIPVATEMARLKEADRAGRILRLFIGAGLLALTVAILVDYLVAHQIALSYHFGGNSTVSFGFAGAVLFGFFGLSFLISGITGYPGCEITAIPNLFSRKKRYCSCLITPYNLPNGRLLQRKRTESQA